MDSNHLVGQFDFAFGNAAKDSVGKVLLKRPACGGIWNIRKMAEGLFSSSSVF